LRTYRIVLYVIVVIPVITGALNVFMGLQAQGLIGAQLPVESFHDPLLNSQMRFYGAIWIGWGLLVYFCLQDVAKYSSLLKGAYLIVLVGGLGRIVSLVQFGLPETNSGAVFVVTVVVIEIVGVPLLLWWHSNLVGKGG
jgi:hypothetical protein